MSKENKWQEELALLKKIIQKAGLVEAIKWGTEVYTYHGKNVVAAAGFKNHFSMWFYNGVFLKDKNKVLVNAQDGKTKALRQWRFTSKDEINEKLILKYIREAIKNEEEGRAWKPERTAQPEMPVELLHILNEDKDLKAAFEKLTPFKQKDFIEHISSAKREETKKARLEKIKPLILAGIGLNDKYKKQ